MSKAIKKIFLLSGLVFIVYSLLFFIVALPVQAQEINNLMENLVGPTPLIRADLISLIFKILRYVLSFLGVVAVVILIYGGFVWMTARGNEEQVRKAKKIIINGLIGLIVVLLSYAIVSFVMRKTQELAQPGLVCTPHQCCANCYRCAADGSACNVWDSSCGTNCIPPGQRFDVVWTYPENGDENISLCALIQAGFNADLDESSVNNETVKIFIRDGKNEGETCQENRECKSDKCENNECQGNTIEGNFVVVKDVFKFSHPDFEKETWYRVIITQRVRSTDGRNLSAQRIIDFKTSTEEDKTPPTVEQTYPEKNQENVCLLDPIQAFFSEPIDVTTLLNEENFYTDPSHRFSRSVPNVKTFNASPGNPYLSNSNYTATLKDNITDVCGNKLDGDNNGEPGGDYSWSFKTGNTLYCDPIIENLAPSSGFYNDEITISGNYFKISGNVVFNQNIFVNHLCFDENKFPRYPCLVSWRNNEIKVKVPATGGASQGAISGPVYVIVGSRFSNSKNFTLLSPYISSFTPTSGGKGQAITLRGERFGSSLGKVYFINENTLERFEGDLICGEAGWKDYEIILAVPKVIDLGNYYLQVQTKDGYYSNVRLDETFEITDQEPGPTLCDITPYCSGTNLRGGKKDDEKTLPGDKFGPNQGRVLFNSTEAGIKSWTNEKIKISVPDISAGTYQVKVEDSNGKLSNPLSFISPCLPRGGLGSACFLDQNTCSLEMCLSPYECLSNGPPLECRCCCTPSQGCTGNLQCDLSQICYKNKTTGVEIYGICCGCNSSNECFDNEICKQKGSGPNCCYACEIGDEGQACNGGQCCSEDCDKFQNQTECLRHDGCSWTGGACTGFYPFCCHGRCVDHQCLSLCGNGKIDSGEECDPGDSECRGKNQTDCQKREGCKWENSICQPKEDLGGKTCQSLGYEGGTLACQASCKFDTSNCSGASGSGYWGDVCKLEIVNGCEFGKKDCLNAFGADCVKNIEAPCACCCRPDYSGCQEIINQSDCEKDFRCEWKDNSCQSKGDSCDLINPKLKCDITQACGESGQKGLCCGCDKDEDCNNGQGFACKNGCCYQFPPPKELKVISAEQDKIRLNWQYEDKNQLATHFEIWKKDPTETEFTILTTCEAKDPYGCNPNQGKFTLKKPSANFYEFEDKRGNFERGKEYFYKIRAKRGSQTAYSQFTEEASGKVSGTLSCKLNTDCPDEAPCCRTDNQVCVDWENCQGNCQIGDKCQPPAIKFATADFWVTEEENGPCLTKVTPNRGYVCEPDLANNLDQVILTGLNFGRRGIGESVFFNGKIGFPFEDEKEACQGCRDCNYQSWQDKEIRIQYTPTAEAQTGLVKVKKIINGQIRWSNGLTFTILRRVVGAGSTCWKDLSGCQRGGGICQPAEVFPCLECDCSQYDQSECPNHFPYCRWNENNNSCENIICENITDEAECQNLSNPPESYCAWKPWKKCITNQAHCRCCCDPSLRGPNDPCKKLSANLECYANQGPCLGANRGLCCGCQKDSDCNLSGNDNGCGILEAGPKCCYPRPILENLSFCDNASPNDVRLNTGITLNFSQRMDFSSLNKDNLKISRAGNCTSINEGETIGQGPNSRCYLYGSIGNENKEEKTQTIFQPKLCRLQPNTTYKLEIVVGENGEGVRSEKGVSMDFTEGKCSWDKTKNCQVEEFTTSNDSNALCTIEWIDVQPRGPVVVRDTNISVNYDGFARDVKNNSVCVESFDWQSSNPNVAVVVTPGLSTIATSKGVGEAKIIAKIPVLNKTCDTSPNHTCGLLKVTLAGPQVIEQRNCDVCELGGQSPSPWKFSPDACLKAQIVARFNRVMNDESIRGNVLVHECQSGDFNNPKCPDSNEPSLPGEITLTPNDSNPTGFRFKPHQPFNPLKIYRVILRSGQNGIKDINGLELDGNKNGIQDGSPTDDYVWYFKTSDISDCPLNKVCLNPPQAKINHPGNQEFKAEIYTANCNYLKAKDFTWNWEKVKIEPWDPDKVATLTPNNEKATATSVGLGEVYVKGSTQGKSDQARLTVATFPMIEDKYPAGNNLCRNVSIWALFDQEMDGKNINSSNIFLEKCKKTAGQKCEEWESVSFRISWQKIERKTKVILTPNNFLEKSTLYKVTIKKEVKSAPPFEREMEKDYSWTFTTGPYICFLEKVKVEPPSHLFTKAKDKKPFTVKALYRETEIQPVPGLYEWDWSWQSTDESIVKVTQDNQQHNLAEAESQSKNGIVNIIAKAIITIDNIFIPSTVGQFKEGLAKIEVWLCENPWPSTKFPEGETYDDNSTNFSFRYCRDAGLPGIDGDLPILKGGKITGPTEPGLEKLTEHFFTVYDGSLSFLYNAEGKSPIINGGGISPNKIENKSGYNNSKNYNIFGDNNASIFGNVVLVTNGKFGSALSFDSNSYLIVNATGVPYGRNLTIEPQNLTLEAWVYLNPRVVSDKPQYIFKKGAETGTGSNPTGRGYGLEIRKDPNTGNQLVYFWIFDKEENKTEISAGPIDFGKWTHLAATYDGRNLKIYFDDVLKNQGQTLKGGISHFDDNLTIGSNFSGLLDEIALWHKTLTQEEIEKHLKDPISPTLGDVLGFKVFSNFEHLKPEEWYKKYAPGITGPTASVTVDGYRAVQVGRTLYVGATNVEKVGDPLNEKIYSNIYLVSQSDNSKSETSKIFSSIINNWRFNINIDNPRTCSLTKTKNCSKDLDCPTGEICNAPKDKLIRDLQRIWDLKIVGQTLEAYREKKGFYPRLESGTYIKHMSVSKWPSWTEKTGLGQDLVKAGLSPLPNDSINQFNIRENCGSQPNQYSCCANCPKRDPKCTDTCYNSATSVYEAIPGSQIYQYMAEEYQGGSAYSFYLNFEYNLPDFWQHGCLNLTQSECLGRAFCQWNEKVSTEEPGRSVPGECEVRRLNYSGDPCFSPSTCPVFNARFSNWWSASIQPPEIISFTANPLQVNPGGQNYFILANKEHRRM